MTIRRSGQDVVKRPIPGPLFYGAEDSVEDPRGESRDRSRERARCGCTQSYGWQKSIGRIARLGSREIARSRGWPGALAGRKPEAPPDAGHGWRKGETVREAHALSTKIV